MKVTVTFEISDRNVKSGLKYWKSIGLSKQTWSAWIHHVVKHNLQSKNIKVRIDE